MLLVEKYRPVVISDIIGFKPSFEINEFLPHLLLYGPPGTGKTTLAKAIIREIGCDSITLNASSERGIDIIRDKVRDFASTQSSNKPIKIIFLDEADHLTPDAQTALRNTMETYSKNCRFILTCNYINRIIDPLKSRCVMIEFNNIPREDIIKRLAFICEQEKIPYEAEALDKIVTNSDIRSAINKLESRKKGVTVASIKSETLIADELFDLIISKDFLSARQFILDKHPDYDSLLIDLNNIIFASSLPLEIKRSSLSIIADKYALLNQVAIKEILVEDMINKLMRLL